jgi:hypothetical protein
VDLDYNYVGQLAREAMQAERPELELALKRVASAGRYQVSQSPEEHAGRKLHLGYRAASGAPDRIELDINYQMRQPIQAPVERNLWQPAGGEPAVVRSVGDWELWAGKITALLDRTLARDLFDVANLPERSPGLEGSSGFRSVVIAWCGILVHPLHAYSRDRLDRVDDASIEQQLVPMLSGSSRPARAELAQRAWSVLEPILELSSNEREYCDRLQQGELRPELLFPDDEAMAQRFREHPALLWKAQNARAHHARTRAAGRGAQG